MIPNNDELFKRLKKEQINSILLQPNNYFKLVEEFTNLQKVFGCETLYDKIMLWVEMVISPLFTIVQSVTSGTLPMFSMLGLQKSFNLWKDWFRWKELQNVIHEWIDIVRSIGGPFISTNDPDYHMFVYADAMVRIHEGLMLSLISKKRTKSLK